MLSASKPKSLSKAAGRPHLELVDGRILDIPDNEFGTESSNTGGGVMPFYDFVDMLRKLQQQHGPGTAVVFGSPPAGDEIKGKLCVSVSSSFVLLD